MEKTELLTPLIERCLRDSRDIYYDLVKFFDEDANDY